MPDSVMSLFPHVLNHLEALKIPVRSTLAAAELQSRSVDAAFAFWRNGHQLARALSHNCSGLAAGRRRQPLDAIIDVCFDGLQTGIAGLEKNVTASLDRFCQERSGELEFLDLFTAADTCQDWTSACDPSKVLLDLPSLKVIDISNPGRHRIENYTVVFAPRAGHHSNIAERVALYLRERGLSRMALVEQKCAEDIPLYVDGRRHHENFEGQVDQYKAVLAHLAGKTGHAPHLIAICQPGPLLMSTLILNPGLGKTFGSAGSPMHTEAESGFLTDFARAAGPGYIDRLITFFGRRVDNQRPGAGRDSFDGRLQVLGFYFLGLEQHLRNFRKLLSDLKQGHRDSAERQKAFYQWYNTVHHFPVGFIRDTFKQIFINNALIHDTLTIGDRTLGIADYPASVPIWALGGAKDTIAPPLQATGHMDLIRTVADRDKLNLLCDGGHMGLFRSKTILGNYYSQIADFLLARSDRTTA
jgi:poly-beta-hydroxyalkanoate depolymerase